MNTPLAHQLRPESIDDIVGQDHLAGSEGIIRKIIEKKALFSMVLFGPPGVGKTTLAIVIAKELKKPYRIFNAVTGNKKELDALFAEGKLSNGLLVIIEEIHRLNKGQQDLLLPHLENGTITIIGTTTSNPYHALNPAIRSRTHLFELKPLDLNDIFNFLVGLSKKEDYIEHTFEQDALKLIAQHAGGDLRSAINIFEICTLASNHITSDVVQSFSKQAQSNTASSEDGYYDYLSALQKSIRGSDVDAALYYLAQLILSDNLEAINRRLLVIAYEDVGLANPNALSRTLDAIEASERIGFPEARIPLAVATVDLALSPKSRSAYQALDRALDYSKKHVHQVPIYLKQTPVALSPEEAYDFNMPHIWHRIQYLPHAIKDKKFYQPSYTSAYEKALAENYKKLNEFIRTQDLRSLKKPMK